MTDWQNKQVYHANTAFPFCSWQDMLFVKCSWDTYPLPPPPQKNETKTKKTNPERDSLILSLRFQPGFEDVQVFNVAHLWGFLRVSHHVSFQHCGPKDKENMAWKGEMRGAISGFL